MNKFNIEKTSYENTTIDSCKNEHVSFDNSYLF